MYERCVKTVKVCVETFACARQTYIHGLIRFFLTVVYCAAKESIIMNGILKKIVSAASIISASAVLICMQTVTKGLYDSHEVLNESDIHSAEISRDEQEWYNFQIGKTAEEVYYDASVRNVIYISDAKYVSDNNDLIAINYLSDHQIDAVNIQPYGTAEEDAFNFTAAGNLFDDMIQFHTGLYTLKDGRFYTKQEIDDLEKVCLISDVLAEKNGLRVGDQLTVTSIHDNEEKKDLLSDDERYLTCTIIGIFSIRNASDQGRFAESLEENRILLPSTTLVQHCMIAYNKIYIDYYAKEDFKVYAEGMEQVENDFYFSGIQVLRKDDSKLNLPNHLKNNNIDVSYSEDMITEKRETLHTLTVLFSVLSAAVFLLLFNSVIHFEAVRSIAADALIMTAIGFTVFAVNWRNVYKGVIDYVWHNGDSYMEAINTSALPFRTLTEGILMEKWNSIVPASVLAITAVLLTIGLYMTKPASKK